MESLSSPGKVVNSTKCIDEENVDVGRHKKKVTENTCQNLVIGSEIER